MGISAYIKLVPASKQLTISLDEVIELFTYYKEITQKTGEQLGWGYNSAAFPYNISEKKDNRWFYLKGTNDREYKYIVVGVDEEKVVDEAGDETTRSYIQIVLPEGATNGDKGKANEFCKFLAKHLEAELHLFNQRVMYFYKRK